MSKYDTLERLSGSVVVPMKDFLKYTQTRAATEPLLSEVENLIVDIIHSANIDNIKKYDVSIVIRKKSTT